MGDIWLILEIKSCFYCFSAFSCFAFPHRVYETYLGGSFLLLALRSNTNFFCFCLFFRFSRIIAILASARLWRT